MWRFRVLKDECIRQAVYKNVSPESWKCGTVRTKESLSKRLRTMFNQILRTACKVVVTSRARNTTGSLQEKWKEWSACAGLF